MEDIGIYLFIFLFIIAAGLLKYYFHGGTSLKEAFISIGAALAISITIIFLEEKFGFKVEKLHILIILIIVLIVYFIVQKLRK